MRIVPLDITETVCDPFKGLGVVEGNSEDVVLWVLLVDRVRE